MESLFTYVSPPSQCGYLPDQDWSLEYDVVGRITRGEYLHQLAGGWRRFGNMLFRPRCQMCRACQSLRVIVDAFRPNRSQKRCRRANERDVRLVIGEPTVSRNKLQLYDRYHAFQATHKSWPLHPAKDASSYAQSFVQNPFPTEEWCYYLDRQLAGVGYVDYLPGGMSAIYFFYEPELRGRSLGTWNVLRLIDECARRKIPHLYLGYFVEGCASLEYKANFVPNQVFTIDGQWVDFQRGD
jgi:arginine-tRNA-protein transferase